MGDPYSLINKRCKSKNIISKILLEKEINKIFESRNIELITQIGSMIEDEQFHNYYQKKLIELESSKFIYLYAKYVEKANIELLEDAILNFNDLKYICMFLKDIENCSEAKIKHKIIELSSVDELLNSTTCVEKEFIEDLIISTKRADLMYEYLLKVDKANIDKFQKAIVYNGTSEDIINFSKYIKNIDIESLEDELIKKRDYHTIYKLAINNKKANVKKLEQCILRSNNAKSIYRFASLVEDANIPLLEEAIIKTNSLKYMSKFMQTIENANKDKILEAIMKSDNILVDKLETLLEIALSSDDIFKNKIEKYIINSNSAKYIYLYAYKIKDASISLLEDKMIELNNITYLCYFALYVKNADIYKIENHIRNSKIDDIKIVIELYETLLDNEQISFSNYEDALINFGSARYMYELVKTYYEKINFEKIEDAIINTNEGEYIYKLAKFKNNEFRGNIKKEEEAIIKTQDQEYIEKIHRLKDCLKQENIENKDIKVKKIKKI